MPRMTLARVRTACSNLSSRVRARFTTKPDVIADIDTSPRTLKRKYRAMKTLSMSIIRQRNNFRTAFVATVAVLLALSAFAVSERVLTNELIASLSAKNADLTAALETKTNQLASAVNNTTVAVNDLSTARGEIASLRQQIADASEAVSHARATVAAKDKELAELSLARVKSVPAQSIEIKDGQPTAVASKDETIAWWNKPITNTVKSLWDDMTK